MQAVAFIKVDGNNLFSANVVLGQLNYCVLLVFWWPLYKKFGAMLFVWSQYNFLLANIDIRTSVPRITHHQHILK